MSNEANTQSILLLFDDRNLGQVIADSLEQQAFSCREVEELDADGLRRELDGRVYDLAVVCMGDNAATLAAIGRLREATDIPVFAVFNMPDKMVIRAAFIEGADDVIFSPISADLLGLKAKALLDRLSGLQVLPTMFQLGTMTLDADLQTLTRGDGLVVHLSGKENDVLQLLAANTNRLVERSYILRKIWKIDNYFNSRSLSVYINHIRHLLEIEPGVRIISVHGKGYKLCTDAENE